MLNDSRDENGRTLFSIRDSEIKNLVDAAWIVDEAAKQTSGEGRIILNNVIAHLLGRIYQNGYTTGNGIY